MSAKRWVCGVRKMVVFLIFSPIYVDIGGWALKMLRYADVIYG